MLKYSSAFDDEVAELADDAAAELPGFPETILESVLEEPAAAVIDSNLESRADEESLATQTDSGRPSTNVVHGPYYYFYQGG